VNWVKLGQQGVQQLLFGFMAIKFLAPQQQEIS